MDNFNFELLRTFLVVCKLKSFSCASDYLYVDQSTISKKIRQLEEKFGLTLFVRMAHGVELTVAGRSFKRRAQQLIADFEKLKSDSPVKWGDLRIGVFDNIAAYCYPHFFTKHFDELRQLKVANEGVKLVDLFNNGELDLIIVNNSLERQIRGEYVQQQLATEKMMVLAGKGHHLSGRDSCAFHDLFGQKLVLAPEYCPVSRKLLKYRARFAKFKMVDYTATMVEIIRNSDFVTILPAGMVHQLTTTNTDLVGTTLMDFPQRVITAFAREQSVLEKVSAALV